MLLSWRAGTLAGSAADHARAQALRVRQRPKPTARPPAISRSPTNRSNPPEVLGNPGMKPGAGAPGAADPVVAAATPLKSGGGAVPKPRMALLCEFVRQVNAGLTGLVLLPLLGPH